MNKRDIVYKSDRATTGYAPVQADKPRGIYGADRKWTLVKNRKSAAGPAPSNAGAVQMGPKGGQFILTPSGKKYVKV